MSRRLSWRVRWQDTGLPLVVLVQRSLLILIAIFYLVGQAGVAWEWDAASPFWLSGFLLLIGAGLILGGLRLAALIGLLCIVFLAGNRSMQQTHQPNLPDLSQHHVRQLALPQKVTLEGWLFQEPDRRPTRGRLYLEVTQVWQDEKDGQNGRPRPMTGKVLVTVRHLTGEWQYGDVLRLTLRLRSPRNFHTPGSFDYERYLARRGIYLSAFLWRDNEIEKIGARGAWLRHQIEQTRRTIGTFFDMQLPPGQAAVLRALIIGDKSQLSPDLRDAFARAGVAHVLAISGLHIGLVATMAYAAWWWLLGRSRYLLLMWTVPKLAALLTVPIILLYAGLAGSNVSTWRAVIMVLVFLTALLIDHREEVFRSLALAAFIISLLWPGAVFDVSFQLSFVAVLAIFIGLHRFRAWSENQAERTRMSRWGILYCLVSVSAMIGTAPIVGAHFNQVSLVGLVSNLLVVPLLGSAAVVLGLASAALLFIHTGLATLVVSCAGVVVWAGMWLVETIAAWPYAAISVVTLTFLELVLFYSLLVTLIFLSQLQSPVFKKVLLSGLLSTILLDGVYWTWQRYFQSDLRVSFLDVGQGDAAVVEFPGSQVMVIDAGGFLSQTFDSGQAIVAPFLWQRKIGRVDTLVLSHSQLDHYGGLTFLAQHFGVKSLWFNGELSDSQRFKRLMAVLQENGVQTHILCRDMPDQEIGGVRIQVLHPPCNQTNLDTNNASLVLRLSHGEVDILFAGDVETAGEHVLLSTHANLETEILKVPHHGSRSSSTLAFIRAVSPQVAIASLGHQNRFRFPAPEVVKRYEKRGARFLRTDQVGAVTVLSDGKSYRVETFLPSPAATVALSP